MQVRRGKRDKGCRVSAGNGAQRVVTIIFTRSHQERVASNSGAVLVCPVSSSLGLSISTAGSSLGAEGWGALGAPMSQPVPHLLGGQDPGWTD